MTSTNKGFTSLLFCIAVLFSVTPSWAQAPERAGDQPISVTADKLTAQDGGTRVEAAGNVEITREPTTLKADEVRVNRITKDVEAKGNVSVDDPEWKVKSADFMQLNLEKETGEIRNGDIFIEEGHTSITGRRFQKFIGQSYHIDEGFFTTCLCESGTPPWRISADSVDLEPGGLGIIRNGFFYVMDIPVLYVPYAFFPLRTERQTGFLFPSFGQSSTEGFRFQQPFFWAISKSTDATVAFDLQTRARIGGLGEFRTMFDQNSDFRLNAAYFDERLRQNEDRDVVDRTIADQEIPKNRWGIVGTHRYTAGDWLTFSDIAAYRDDLFTRELIERFDLPGIREGDIKRSRFSTSRFGVFRGWSNTFLKAEWDFYQDFIQRDETTLHRTPQIAFWGRRFFAGFPLEFRWRGEGINYLRREGGDGLRFDLRPEVILPLRMPSFLFGSLSVAPRETAYHLYSPVKASDRNTSRELVEIRGNIGTSASRIFSVDGAELRGIRHVIEPELSYLFVPRVNQSRIPIMDAVDRVNRRNVFTIALTNRLWGKFVNPLAASGDKDVELLNPAIGGDVRDLASLRLALSYDIDKERKGGDSLSDLDMNLRVTPTALPLTIGLNMGLNPGPWQITQARASFGVTDPRPITRQSLDPDFNRPNAASLSFSFLRRNNPNGLLAENANIDLDAPPNCPEDRLDPRCRGFDKNIVGHLDGNLFYRVTDRLLFFLNATYDVRDSRFPGYRAAIKILPGCDCWSLTFSLRRSINPDKTSFGFDFNLLGLSTPRRTLQ